VCSGSLSSTHLDLYFNARAEQGNNGYKAIDSESSKGCISNAGEISSGNPSMIVCGAQGKGFAVERLDDFSCQDSPEQADGLRAALTSLSDEDRALLERGKVFDAANRLVSLMVTSEANEHRFPKRIRRP